MVQDAILLLRSNATASATRGAEWQSGRVFSYIGNIPSTHYFLLCCLLPSLRCFPIPTQLQKTPPDKQALHNLRIVLLAQLLSINAPQNGWKPPKVLQEDQITGRGSMRDFFKSPLLWYPSPLLSSCSPLPIPPTMSPPPTERTSTLSPFPLHVWEQGAKTLAPLSESMIEPKVQNFKNAHNYLPAKWKKALLIVSNQPVACTKTFFCPYSMLPGKDSTIVLFFSGIFIFSLQFCLPIGLFFRQPLNFRWKDVGPLFSTGTTSILLQMNVLHLTWRPSSMSPSLLSAGRTWKLHSRAALYHQL